MSSLKNLLLRYGTPFTVGLFVVSAVSGVALYFHVGVNLFREMHEVLSMVLLVPVVFHLWRNWAPFARHFREVAMPLALVVSLAAAGVYVYNAPAESAGGNPAFGLARAAQKAPVSALAPVLGLDEAALLKRLEAAGFPGVAPGDSIEGVARRSGRNGMEILAALQKPAP